MPSSFYIAWDNPNIQPTVFINPELDNIYIYYTNVKEVEQYYSLSTDNLLSLYPEAISVTPLIPATIYTVDALRRYSTAGNNTLYDINECYNTMPFPIEITSIDSMTNVPSCYYTVAPNKCMVVPANSAGYIKIPLHVSYRLGEETNKTVNLYPNPANSYFTITTDCNESECEEEIHDIKIYNSQGNLYMQTQLNESNTIDITMLPAGIYQVVISDTNSLITKTLIKQ